MSQLVVNTDGGARGNPGPAAIGVVMSMGEWRHEHSRCLGSATNNVAEYTALIDALGLVRRFLEEGKPIESVAFRLDSELVVKQISRIYRVKEPTLQTLCQKAQEALAALPVSHSISHVPRAQNAAADRLVNQALDAAS